MKTTYTYKNLPHAFLMCVVLCLFGVFFSSQAYAQQEELLDKTWYLYKLEMDGEEYEYYSLDILADNDESRIEIMDYDINNLTAAFEFDGCPGWGMFLTIEFVENEEKFILLDFGGLTLEYCYYWEDSVEYEIIEDFFFSFYHNYGSIIEYNFETIDAIEYLIFTDENNDKLYYTAENLSTPDFEAFGLSVYPNPVDDRLNIRFLELPNNTSIEIYDVQGKLLENLVLSGLETQLDVSEYASGLYFIKIEDASGKQKVTKFVKK